MLDLELALLSTEGLFNGLLVILLLLLIPFTLIYHPYLLLIPFLFDLGFFLIPTLILTAYRHQRWRILVYLPLFYIARFISCIIFLKSFIKVVIAQDLKMGWNKAKRYQVD